jgi:hypothetical protein
MWKPAVLAIMLAACGAQLGDHAGGGQVDASGSGSGSGSGMPDAAGAVTPDAAPDAPACFNGRTVFLDFDGVTLTQAGTTDSTKNYAAWIGVTSAVIPQYQAGVANRATLIQNITDGVRATLSGYPVTVVTTRPAAGPYTMIAFGGTKTIVGSTYGYATSDHDCGDLVKSDVGWVSDTVPQTIVISTAVGTIGWALGLQGTTDVNDCMCGWASACSSTSNTCTLGTAQATGTSTSPATTCPGLTVQDEQAAFQTAFCQ